MPPPSLAQQERTTLCDLLVERGPDAPTLCEGWSTADLAAHLVVRERRPDSGPGLVWPPLAGYTDKVRTAVRDRTPWEKLVETVRRGPPLLLRPFDGPMNTVEFFIHVEDVRRAQEGWEPRPIPPELADALWARVGPGGMAKKVPATIVITSPGRAEKERGTGPRLTLAGDPGELTMFGSGRQGAARVEISGDARSPHSCAPRRSVSDRPDREPFLGSVTVQPRRRSTAASCSEASAAISFSCAESRHADAATAGLPSDSASSSWAMKVAASSREKLPRPDAG